MKKVIIPFKENKELFCKEALELLCEAGFEVVTNDTGNTVTEEMLKEMIRDAEAIVAGAEMYPQEILSCGKKLKAIARFGVGTDNIDLEYCVNKGIGVSRIINHNSVAEYTITLMLSLIKNLLPHDDSARKAYWERFSMRELAGKKVGLVGFGRIGSRLSVFLKAFDAEVMAYDPFISENIAEQMGVKIVPRLEEMISTADIISLHLPLTNNTYHLFDKEMLKKCKTGAFLVNTSRGAIIKEEDLYWALTSGKLAGAAIDVFEKEPLCPDNLIISLPNVVVSPHVSALSYETNYNGSIICAKAIIAMCKGEKPEYPVIWPS